jgi:hypothetical protein
VVNFEEACAIALTLPHTRADTFGVGVVCGAKVRGFAWVWQERVAPKKPRVPCYDVLAIRTADLEEKALLLLAEPIKFFTEPHYDNYPAVLVRLQNIERDELYDLLVQGWRCMATKTMLKAFDAQSPED